MIAGAGEKNEFDQPSPIIKKLCEKPFQVIETNAKIPDRFSETRGLYRLQSLGTARWIVNPENPFTFEVVVRKEKLNIPNAIPLALYEDGKNRNIYWYCSCKNSRPSL